MDPRGILFSGSRRREVERLDEAVRELPLLPLRPLLAGLCHVALASLFLRFLLSDSFFPLNYNAYIPSACYLFAAVALPWAMKVSWQWRLSAAGVLLVGGAIALFQEQPRLLSAPPAPVGERPEGTIRLLLWNVQAYHGGMEEIIGKIQEVDPDILCLVEGTFADRAPDQVRRALGRDYSWAVGRRLSIASRIPLSESQQVTTNRSMVAMRAVVSPEGHDPFALVLADVNPPFRRTENEVFEELWLLRHSEELPLMMAGDFNTPRHSRRLNRAFGGLRETLHEAGRERWIATWPAWALPLWQLDYVFLSDEFQIIDSRLGSDRTSDHLAVILDFLPPQPAR